MYSKTASLSTAVGAAPEIIKDEENGFLVPSGNDHLLHTKLKMIMTLSQEKRELIGKRGHETIVNNFSIEKHVTELMKLYKK